MSESLEERRLGTAEDASAIKARETALKLLMPVRIGGPKEAVAAARAASKTWEEGAGEGDSMLFPPPLPPSVRSPQRTSAQPAASSHGMVEVSCIFFAPAARCAAAKRLCACWQRCASASIEASAAAAAAAAAASAAAAAAALTNYLAEHDQSATATAHCREQNGPAQKRRWQQQDGGGGEAVPDGGGCGECWHRHRRLHRGGKVAHAGWCWV